MSSVTERSRRSADDRREQPPAGLPVLGLPPRVADIVGATALGAVFLIVISSAIDAFTYRLSGLSTDAGSLNFSDRLSLFTRSGATLGVALVLMLGVFVLGAAGSDRQLDDRYRWRDLGLLAGLILGAVVTLADAVVSVQILANAAGRFAPTSGNRIGAALAHASPLVLALGACAYAWLRVRSRGADLRLTHPQDAGSPS